MTERMTISMPDDLAERINDQLEWGDNRSELVRDLLREALDEREDEVHEPQDTETKTERQRRGTPQLPEDTPATVDQDEAAEAIQAAVTYLKEHGSATMREIVSDVMPEHDLGYDVPQLEPAERYRGSWWRRVVRPALQEHDSVSGPDPGQSDWRWTG